MDATRNLEGPTGSRRRVFLGNGHGGKSGSRIPLLTSAIGFHRRAYSHRRCKKKAPTAGTNGALSRYARRTDLRGSAMAAERILQAAILGLFIFSIVLASMLIMK